MEKADKRTRWLHCLVAVCRNTAALVTNADGNTDALPLEALLLDRRLIKAKGLRITSFIGGGVLTFLSDASLFPDSTVLDAVPWTTLEAFTSLIRHALGTAQRRFKLLRLGSEGTPATAAAFHSRCDAQGPTLTLIKDTAGNVFGGYTSLHWSADAGEDGNGYVLDDPANFLFTVVNPHADPPALFPSKTDTYSIVSALSAGPVFYDLCIDGEFDGGCCADIGRCYVNSTRHSGDTVLTGAAYFTPAEVEVWVSKDD